MSMLPIGSQFGSYIIVRHIGGGGMAQIYLAKTRGLAGFEKHLALKVINPDQAGDERFIQMLIDEAKLTVGLTHVNIAQVFDLGQVEGIYYIAMEFVEGVDVLELVNGLHALGEKVPIEAAAYIARLICSGLHFAHSRTDAQGQPLNIVHRDISPQNILVSRSGEIKVVDFGIAKAAGMQTRTQAGVIKGKVHYMAPEQAQGEKADRRSDIFATGIVLWETLTSKMVYSGDNQRELVDRVRQARIPPPSTYRPEIPAALDAVVMKALARVKEERFQDAHQFQVALTKFLAAHAPDYGGTHLAELVSRVLARKNQGRQEVEQHFAAEDIVADDHSIVRRRPEPPVGGPPDRHRLLVEGEQGTVVQLIDDELLIGRAGQLAVADARVSRRHAIIRRQGQELIIEDLGSSNGTYVNDVRLTEPQVLRDGDQVRLGSCKMHYRAPRVEPSVKGPPPLPEPPPRRPRVSIRCGEHVSERPIGEELLLEYRITVGPATLRSTCGRLTPRMGGYLVEPFGERDVLCIAGQPIREPTPLRPGDTFEAGEFQFQLLE